MALTFEETLSTFTEQNFPNNILGGVLEKYPEIFTDKIVKPVHLE